MTHTREEVLATAQAIFGKDNLDAVMTALDEFGMERHEREVDRVKLAILEISEGDMGKLRYWVKIAKADYRDALAARQLGPLSPEDGARWQAMAQNLSDRWGKK